MRINTPDDWWELLDASWDNIIMIFDRVGAPLHTHRWDETTSKDDLPQVHAHTLREELYNLRTTRNHERLHHWLERVWGAASDSPRIHEWPGWSQLCDLCSEYGVAYPPPMEQYLPEDNLR